LTDGAGPRVRVALGEDPAEEEEIEAKLESDRGTSG
jgi:hypothetical protein